MSGRPFIVKVSGVQIVVIITGKGNYVCVTVGNAHQLISLPHHLIRIGVTVVPCVHNHIVGLDGSVTVGVCKGSPYARLLPEALHISDITVCKGTELLHHGLVLIGIFVGADMHSTPHEHGTLSPKILCEKRVHKGVYFRFG